MTDHAPMEPAMQTATATQDFVSIEGLSYAYPGTERYALKDVSISVARGEFACVLGPSGCGKSTLLNILTGLATPQEGTVVLDGQVLAADGRAVPAEERARLGYVFQDARLLPWRTVRQNIELALKAARVPKDEWEERVMRYLELCEIARFVDSWPGNLSGGQRQRVAIARALAIEPASVLMDEPFSTLDEVTARFLRAELLEIWERTGRTVIFITHSIREAVFLADHIYVMTAGPGRVLERITIDVPRPRRYEDPHLTELEGEIVSSVLQHWGYAERVPGSAGH
jgi:NitT/TauT family transport system ATP-binding protein